MLELLGKIVLTFILGVISQDEMKLTKRVGYADMNSSKCEPRYPKIYVGE